MELEPKIPTFDTKIIENTTMMMMKIYFILLCSVAALLVCNDAFILHSSQQKKTSMIRTITTTNNKLLLKRTIDDDDNDAYVGSSSSSRRQLFEDGMKTIILGSSMLAFPTTTANALAQRAVGGAELECREAGTCLEIGQLDGAVGWTWGGKDRCDPADPRCGPDGKLGEAPKGQPIPKVTNKITHLAQLIISIGREETGAIRMGFYGEDCPESVRQMLKFLSSGITTTSSLAFESGMGVRSAPVSLADGGIIPDIVPSKVIDFGVPSQSLTYARNRGLRKAGDEFLPQPRPDPEPLINEPFPRPHDVAGLISIPQKGIGYGGSGFESDDDAFESSFQITADSVPTMDKSKRRVIGQIIDDASMAFLARLSSLPTKKGIKGVIPGLTSGPPLLKVIIQDVEVKKVT